MDKSFWSAANRELEWMKIDALSPKNLVLLALVVACQSSLGQDEAKRNLLLICVDDLKPAIGCYGDPLAITPNIDRLAARGLRLDSAYCNQAVCSPSRNALLTSLRPQTLGIYDLGTNFRNARPDAATMGQHFQQHGYTTQSLGKVFHVGHGNRDDADSWTLPSFRPRAAQYSLPKNQPSAVSQKSQKKNGQEPKGPPTESADVPDETYADGQIAAEAVRRLQTQQLNQPFFLAVGFLKPHLPFVAPKKYWDLHDPAKFPLPASVSPPEGAPVYAPQFGGELRNYRDVPTGNRPLDNELTRHLIHGYYAATSYMDAQVGKLLAALDETGLAKTTIVVLWGDHGWHLGDHGMWCKHTNYEQATRIPLIVADPLAPPGSSKSLVESVDVFPTVAALAGLPAPVGIDGQSFAHLLAMPELPHREFVTHVYPRGERLGRGIRTDRYRLVEWKKIGEPETSAEFELYDYLQDPGENKNLADAFPNVVRSLRSLLAKQSSPRPQVRTTN